ncbi:MAG: HupE/UreJ family protein [Rhodothermales bacterium]|nr:HupE/UreJ family protein [Rhodothermales bacterium]
MESTFLVYLRLGFEHIADPSAYDHLLFVIVLVAIYTIGEWKRLLVLVTAFTVGHSLTLALATLRLISVESGLVEFLIPVTILLTAALNTVEVQLRDEIKDADSTLAWRIRYVIALVFGLIHGLGFSNFLRAILGEEERLLLPLFSFNVGLEIGQILILSATLIVSGVVVQTTALTQRIWGMILSVTGGIVALTMIL